jgi:hypothetical protein
VVPWLITTSGWPALTAHLVGVTARAAVDPVTVAGGSTGALALAGAVLLCWRVRERLAEAQASVAAPSASAAPPSGA